MNSKKTPCSFLCFFLLFIFLLFSFPTRAAETITDFHSDIYVLENGSVTVKETITVNREGKQIRRGIYRDLPKTKGVRYSVISVKRDGVSEPYFTENVGRYFRINTGNDKYLPHDGLYTFEITYQASDVIMGFDTYDEIYWNVTGNEWDFPIEHASAKVFLPQEIGVRQSAGYFGPHGSNTSAVFDEETGVFSVPGPLSPKEGLTVAVGFDKGYVKKSFSFHLTFSQYVQLATMIMAAYMFITWHLYGRDPEKPAAMPRFKGPEGLSPVQAGWIYSYGMAEDDCFTIAFLQNCISGFIRMEENNNVITIKKLREPKNKEEKILSDTLMFPFKLTGGYSPAMEKCKNSFHRFLEKRSDDEYFTSNNACLFWGVVLLILLTFGLCYSINKTDVSYALGISAFFFVFLGKHVIFSFMNGKNFLGSALFLLLPCVVLFTLFSQGMKNPELSLIFIFYSISVISMAVYSYLIIRPTEKGTQFIAYMDGVKMFLTAMDPTLVKQVDFNKMEALLPYAYLFGLEKEWEAKMKIVMANREYNPSWYHGHAFNVRNIGKMSSSLNKAGTPPSHSGSKGGGHSGGGFGGGGGGGR